MPPSEENCFPFSTYYPSNLTWSSLSSNRLLPLIFVIPPFLFTEFRHRLPLLSPDPFVTRTTSYRIQLHDRTNFHSTHRQPWSATVIGNLNRPIFTVPTTTTVLCLEIMKLARARRSNQFSLLSSSSTSSILLMNILSLLYLLVNVQCVNEDATRSLYSVLCFDKLCAGELNFNLLPG